MDAQEEARRLVDAYTPTIMRIGYTYLNSKEDAEDICQETLLKLIQGSQRFNDTEHEKAWVIRTAINACKNELKRAGRKRSVGLEEAHECTAEARTDEHWILDKVQELPEAYREAIFLHYGEGYKIREIAEMTDRTETSVAKNLSRAREMLRAALGVDFS